MAPWAQECHFAVGPVSPNVSVSDLWRQQHRGNHTNAPGRDYSRDSIGVCLIGDFSVDRPTPSQFEALVALLRSLQQTCRIPADHVYLHSDVDYRSSRPGPGLPARELAERLIHASR